MAYQRPVVVVGAINTKPQRLPEAGVSHLLNAPLINWVNSEDEDVPEGVDTSQVATGKPVYYLVLPFEPLPLGIERAAGERYGGWLLIGVHLPVGMRGGE